MESLLVIGLGLVLPALLLLWFSRSLWSGGSKKRPKSGAKNGTGREAPKPAERVAATPPKRPLPPPQPPRDNPLIRDAKKAAAEDPARVAMALKQWLSDDKR